LTGYDPSLALLIAAQWHDAVYFPNAGSDANERCSSAALGIAAHELARSVEFTQEQKDAVNKAQDLIENTHIAVHLRRDFEGPIKGELAILLDANLASLASDWDKFAELQSNIIRENSGTVPDDFGNSAKFLVSFLRCRKFIYHTAKGRELWEDKAKANITRWCTENGVSIKDDDF
jgi:predicted metal-dependent HD superfamily phosphohydrolase